MSAMKGDVVKFKKNGKTVRGTIDSIFYADRSWEFDEEPVIEGFAVSRMVGDTEYVTYEENVVFV
jgi:hypothetical protein